MTANTKGNRKKQEIYSDKQLAAIRGEIPMDYPLFLSCLNRCLDVNDVETFSKLNAGYPEFMELNMADWRKANENGSALTPEEGEAMKERIFQRIRDLYGEDAI
ncbi:MAG TPA: hypothetical protein H9671_03530 [Firmicutes bacterium]|nr:hypothetical protein [Bacillota bacterium]